MSFKEKIKHAFALTPGDVPVGESLPSILEKFAQQVVQRGLETPAIFFLEMVKPLNFLGSQMVYAAVPMVGILTDPVELDEMAKALEHRDSVMRLVERIEQLSGRRA
ncbi:MAG: hypothetical protein JXX29_21200 [Deltaproteobacteria bacterium]|nr:hypothetical protein [Deltaproteobacteria bacterium]MBN2674213.1 hypothetical protein [Deltaproteobacteria bacterium]